MSLRLRLLFILLFLPLRAKLFKLLSLGLWGLFRVQNEAVRTLVIGLFIDLIELPVILLLGLIFLRDFPVRHVKGRG